MREFHLKNNVWVKFYRVETDEVFWEACHDNFLKVVDGKPDGPLMGIPTADWMRDNRRIIHANVYDHIMQALQMIGLPDIG